MTPAAPVALPVMIDPTGRAVELPAEDVESARSLGYTDASPEARNVFATKRMLAQKYGGDGQALIAGLESAGSAATFGLSTGAEQLFGVDANDIRQRELAHPTAATVGTIAGTALPLLVPGLGELDAARGIGEALSLTAPAQLARLGGAATKTVEGALPDILGTAAKRVVARAAGSSLEGAAVGLGQTVHEGMIDPKLAAESAIANVGFGALLGAGFGGGGELLSGVAKASAPKIVPWLQDLEGSSYAKSLGLDTDAATIRQFKAEKLVGPGTTPAMFMRNSKALLRRAEALGEAAVNESDDVLTPAREHASRLATLAQKGIDLAEAAGEQKEKAPESVMLELLGGIHGGLTEAAGAWALKHGLKLLLPKGLEPSNLGRQLLGESAGHAASLLEGYFPLPEIGAMPTPLEESSPTSFQTPSQSPIPDDIPAGEIPHMKSASTPAASSEPMVPSPAPEIATPEIATPEIVAPTKRINPPRKAAVPAPALVAPVLSGPAIGSRTQAVEALNAYYRAQFGPDADIASLFSPADRQLLREAQRARAAARKGKE